MKRTLIPGTDMELVIDDRTEEELLGEAELAVKNLCRELCFCRDVAEMTAITDRILWINRKVIDLIKNKNN